MTTELMKQNEITAVSLAPEVDIQIATAHRYPRNVAADQKAAEDLATSSQEIALECGYIRPVGKNRAGVMQFASGPSIRALELIMSTWGNLRCAVRVVGEVGNSIVVEAAVHDMQSNVAYQAQVSKPIVGKKGNRYPDSMIDTVIAAASSIALRNALIRVIPRSIVDSVCRKADEKAVPAAQQDAILKGALANLQSGYGVTEAMIREALGMGPAAFTHEQVVTVIKMGTALRDGDIRVDDIWPEGKQRQERPAPPHDPETGEVKDAAQDFDPDNL
jgi:hypothetical protein